MSEHSEHPDDATLFDLIEGRLDDARARQVEQHLDGCRACGELVTAALAGSPDDTSPIEPMPSEASDRLHLAVSGAWRERMAAITRDEAAQDLATEPLPVTAPLTAATSELVGARRPRGRMRLLVPILGFGALAMLAGTSIFIGNDRSVAPSGGRAAELATDESSFDAAGENAAIGAMADAAREAAAPVESPAAATATPETEAGAMLDAAPPGSKRVIAQIFEPHESCIATFDESQLLLPDGRTPRQIMRGPLNIYVLCG